jgi:hypothetical protein
VRGRLIASAAISFAAAIAGGGCEKDEPSESASEPAESSERAAARDAGAGLRAKLATSVRDMRVTVENSCPPPALLACRPGFRLSGELPEGVSARLRQDLALAVPAALRRLGYRRVEIRQRRQRNELVGRAVSGPETLARWRTRERVLELVTGGLRL